MATLTTSYQKLAESSYTAGSASGRLAIYGKYNSQSTENNQTSVTFQLRTYTVVGSFYSTQNSSNLNCGGDRGTQYFDIGSVGGGEKTIGTWTFTLTHSEDGTYSGSASAWADVYAGAVPSVYCSFSLPRIYRYPILSPVSDFTDEENPSIAFTNYNLYDLYAVIYVGDTEIYKSSKLGTGITSYTLDLDEDYSVSQTYREKLQELSADTSQLSLRIGVQSYTGSTFKNFSESNVKMNIVNASPTLSYTVAETNSSVINMFGTSSASSIVKNASILQFNVTPTTYKYATVKEIIVGDATDTTNKQKKTSSPYTFELPVKNSNNLYVEITDSRNDSSITQDNQRTLIDYLAVSINSYLFKRQNPTSSNVYFSGEFTYWGNVGSNVNTPVVKYKLDNGSWVTIPSSNYTIDSTNHKLTISNYTISNILSYQLQGQFSISIEDILTSASDTSDNGKVLRGIPTFDVGEHDLQVNGDLYIADTDRDNAINVGSSLSSLQSSITNLTPVSLYNNSTGTTTGFDLSESINNFSYLEIYYRTGDGTKYKGSTKILLDGSAITASLIFIHFFSNTYYLKVAEIGINNKAFSFSANFQAINGGTPSSGNQIYVTRVLGYK